MKILETRRTGEEILLLSWSPKMDLLAIVNVKGELSLHRLSWQRVWQWKLSDSASPATTGTAGVSSRPPGFISWHPEGLFIIVGFDRTAYILDVETGKDVHRHDLPSKLQFIKWSASKFEILANADNGSTPLMGGSDVDNDVENERTELYLSILVIGTCHGKIYTYTGGLLLSLILTLPTPAGQGQGQPMITTGAASPGLDYFHFLVQGQAHTLTLVQFYNEAIPEMANLLAPLALKQTSLRNNWSKIQSQLTTLSEHWEKIVDIYTHYMTYGKTRDSEEVVGDYTELLLVGFGSVELEFFLGSTVGMREKEAKKHMNTLNTGFIGISDSLAKIKQLIMLIVMDLVEIEGFLKHITRDTTSHNGLNGNGNGNGIVADIRTSFGQLYFVAFHLLKRTQDFFGVFRHFMRLIVNTAHVYHVTEAAVDFIEEDSDPDKVLEFLNTKVEKNIFDFLLENMSKENSAAADAEKLPKPKATPGVKFGDVHLFDFNTASETADSDAASVKTPWTTLQDYLAKNGGTTPTPFLMDFSVTALGTLLDSSQLIPTVSGKFDKLFQIPVINSTPFCTTEYNLMTNTNTDGTGKKCSTETGMYMDAISGKTYVYVFSGQDKDSKIFLFEHDSLANTISSTCLTFSRAIHSCQFFGGPTTYLSVLSYNPDDKKELQVENGRAILCQVPLRLIPPKGRPVVPFNNIVPVNVNMADSYTEIPVDIPIDIFSPGPTTSTYIDQILPIDDFSPLKFAVSGPRKVGAILGVNRRTVLLLEMDTIEGSPDDDETGTEVEDDSFDSHGGGGGGDQRLSF